MSLPIIELLKAKGFSVSAIANNLSVSRQAVYDCIYCRRNSSRRIRLHLAFTIGRPPSLLFSSLADKIKIVDDFEYMSVKNPRASV